MYICSVSIKTNFFYFLLLYYYSFLMYMYHRTIDGTYYLVAQWMIDVHVHTVGKKLDAYLYLHLWRCFVVTEPRRKPSTIALRFLIFVFIFVLYWLINLILRFIIVFVCFVVFEIPLLNRS